ncbi:MAG: glycosyltransferase [Fulvivirga sp.]|uniref:glycosyltransferase n=1 Tax=Fulvivirga sp. TaxID=1931237 RepID=UPI0032EF371D
MSSSVSVIIPVYNRVGLIVETLKSLVSNKHQEIELEVIVIDDGSTDGGAELLAKEYPWIRLFSQENQGAPTARNYGLHKAKGEYILYLDSDDLIEENFFFKKIRAFENNRGVIGVYGPFDYFDADTKTIIPRHSVYPTIPTPHSEEHIKNLLGGWFIPCNAFLWRKDALMTIGGQREELIINQDVDLTFRALLKGKIVGVDAPKALIRQHKSERVGVLNSETKLKAMLELRLAFMETLTLNGINNNSFKQATGRYLFNLWTANRKEYPKIAAECLAYSKELYPNLKLQGGRFLQILDNLLGAERTIVLKDRINKLVYRNN